MSEEYMTNYENGDIVWVKLGPSWWPGEVKDLTTIPSDEIEFKKPPLAVVKFFEEDTYEYVRNWSNIYPYNCEKKSEFIKKGMAAFRSKAPHMEKFPKDVASAEVKIGGNPNILSEPEFRPEVKRNYVAEVFGTPNAKKKGNKETTKKPRTFTKNQNQTDTAHITHRRFLGLDDYKAYVCIQHPGKDRIPGDSEDEEVIRINREPEREYNCHTCSYSTKRQDVMVLHLKSHIYNNYVPSPKRKRPVVTKSRKREPVKKLKEKKEVSRTFTDDSSSDELPKPPKEKKRKSKSSSPKKSTEVAEEVKPKNASDICNDLLAEWEDTDDEIERSLHDFSATQFNETAEEVQMDLNDKIDEEIKEKENGHIELPEEEIELSEDKNKEESIMQPKVLPKPTMDKETQEAIKSCFDFEEDEEEELLTTPVAIGRKIPRVIPPTEKRKSEILDDLIDLEEEGINKEEILKVSQSFNDKRGESTELESAFKDLMDETAVPKLPEMDNSLKPAQNFHCVKTIKFPDKLVESPKKDRDKDVAEIATIPLNPKKRFVKSFEDFENQLQREEIRRREEELKRKERKNALKNLQEQKLSEINQEDKGSSSDDSTDLTNLQSTIMSKIIEEAKMNEESRNRIMSRIHKKRTPRSKILDSYYNDTNKDITTSPIEHSVTSNICSVDNKTEENQKSLLPSDDTTEKIETTMDSQCKITETIVSSENTTENEENPTYSKTKTQETPVYSNDDTTEKQEADIIFQDKCKITEIQERSTYKIPEIQETPTCSKTKTTEQQENKSNKKQETTLYPRNKKYRVIEKQQTLRSSRNRTLEIQETEKEETYFDKTTEIQETPMHFEIQECKILETHKQQETQSYSENKTTEKQEAPVIPETEKQETLVDFDNKIIEKDETNVHTVNKKQKKSRSENRKNKKHKQTVYSKKKAADQEEVCINLENTAIKKQENSIIENQEPVVESDNKLTDKQSICMNVETISTEKPETAFSTNEAIETFVHSENSTDIQETSMQFECKETVDDEKQTTHKLKDKEQIIPIEDPIFHGENVEEKPSRKLRSTSKITSIESTNDNSQIPIVSSDHVDETRLNLSSTSSIEQSKDELHVDLSLEKSKSLLHTEVCIIPTAESECGRSSHKEESLVPTQDSVASRKHHRRSRHSLESSKNKNLHEKPEKTIEHYAADDSSNFDTNQDEPTSRILRSTLLTTDSSFDKLSRKKPKHNLINLSNKEGTSSSQPYSFLDNSSHQNQATVTFTRDFYLHDRKKDANHPHKLHKSKRHSLKEIDSDKSNVKQTESIVQPDDFSLTNTKSEINVRRTRRSLLDSISEPCKIEASHDKISETIDSSIGNKNEQDLTCKKIKNVQDLSVATTKIEKINEIIETSTTTDDYFRDKSIEKIRAPKKRKSLHDSFKISCNESSNDAKQENTDEIMPRTRHRTLRSSSLGTSNTEKNNDKLQSDLQSTETYTDEANKKEITLSNILASDASQLPSDKEEISNVPFKKSRWSKRLSHPKKFRKMFEAEDNINITENNEIVKKPVDNETNIECSDKNIWKIPPKVDISIVAIYGARDDYRKEICEQQTSGNLFQIEQAPTEKIDIEAPEDNTDESKTKSCIDKSIIDIENNTANDSVVETTAKIPEIRAIPDHIKDTSLNTEYVEIPTDKCLETKETTHDPVNKSEIFDAELSTETTEQVHVDDSIKQLELLEQANEKISVDTTATPPTDQFIAKTTGDSETSEDVINKHFKNESAGNYAKQMPLLTAEQENAELPIDYSIDQSTTDYSTQQPADYFVDQTIEDVPLDYSTAQPNVETSGYSTDEPVNYSTNKTIDTPVDYSTDQITDDMFDNATEKEIKDNKEVTSEQKLDESTDNSIEETFTDILQLSTEEKTSNEVTTELSPEEPSDTKHMFADESNEQSAAHNADETLKQTTTEEILPDEYSYKDLPVEESTAAPTVISTTEITTVTPTEVIVTEINTETITSEIPPEEPITITPTTEKTDIIIPTEVTTTQISTEETITEILTEKIISPKEIVSEEISTEEKIEDIVIECNTEVTEEGWREVTKTYDSENVSIKDTITEEPLKDISQSQDTVDSTENNTIESVSDIQKEYFEITETDVLDSTLVNECKRETTSQVSDLLESEDISKPNTELDKEIENNDAADKTLNNDDTHIELTSKPDLNTETSEFNILCSTQSEEFSVSNTSIELPEDAIYEPTTKANRRKRGRRRSSRYTYKKKRKHSECVSEDIDISEEENVDIKKDAIDISSASGVEKIDNQSEYIEEDIKEFGEEDITDNKEILDESTSKTNEEMFETKEVIETSIQSPDQILQTTGTVTSDIEPPEESLQIKEITETPIEPPEESFQTKETTETSIESSEHALQIKEIIETSIGSPEEQRLSRELIDISIESPEKTLQTKEIIETPVASPEDSVQIEERIETSIESPQDNVSIQEVQQPIASPIPIEPQELFIFQEETVVEDLPINQEELKLEDVVESVTHDVQVTIDDSITAQVTIDDSVTTRVTIDDSVTSQVTIDDSVTAQVTIDDSVTSQVTIDDSVTAEIAIDDSLTSQVTIDDSVISQVTIDGSVTTEVAIDDSVTTEVTMDDSVSSYINEESVSSEIAKEPTTLQISFDTTEEPVEKVLAVDEKESEEVESVITKEQVVLQESTETLEQLVTKEHDLVEEQSVIEETVVSEEVPITAESVATNEELITPEESLVPPKESVITSEEITDAEASTNDNKEETSTQVDSVVSPEEVNIKNQDTASKLLDPYAFIDHLPKLSTVNEDKNKYHEGSNLVKTPDKVLEPLFSYPTTSIETVTRFGSKSSFDAKLEPKFSDMSMDDEDEKLTNLVSDIVQKLNEDDSEKNQEDLDIELEEVVSRVSLKQKSPEIEHTPEHSTLPTQTDYSQIKKDVVGTLSSDVNIDLKAADDNSNSPSQQDDENSSKFPKEIEVLCASSPDDTFKFCIQTNLSNLSRSEEISAIALATLSEIKNDVECSTTIKSSEDPVTNTDIRYPEKLSETEMVAIEGNLTVMSEKDLADAQVEITTDKVISSKKPVTLSSFSMDFSDSTSDSGSINDTSSDVSTKYTDFDSKGTEFTSRAMTKELKPKINTKKVNAYDQCELLNILEGNVDGDKKVVEFQTPTKTFTDDICDFEEHIPSQIVCTKQFKQDLDDEIKKKDKSSVISTTSKLLERLTEMKSDIKKELPVDIAAKSIKQQKIKSKPIILSEQIIKPASDPKKVIPPSNNTVNDIEDVEAFVIHKDIKKHVEETTEEKVSPAKNSRKSRIRPIGKAKILQQTIITPAGEIIQPTATLSKKAVIVNAPVSTVTTRISTEVTSSILFNKTPKATVVKQPPVNSDSANQDDNDFDIFNMPIVLSDQILTPESIENMPIVIDSASSPTVNKPAQTLVAGTATKLPLNKVMATTASTLITTKVSPKLTKPRILQTVTAKPGLPLPSGILPRTSKPGKYIIVSQNTPGIPTQKYITKKAVMKRTSLPASLAADQSEGSGNKIMVVTNQQGQQQRLLLTPAQQKVLGYQSPVGPKVTKTVVKTNILQKNLLTPVVKTDASTSKLPLLGQKIITTTSQIISGTSTSKTVKPVMKRVPSTNQKVIPSGKTPKTILITNKHGQTIKKIATTEDDIDKQVAEQLEAIKASSGMQFSSQPKTEPLSNTRPILKHPIRRPNPKKQEPKLKTIPITTKSELIATPPPLVSTSKKILSNVPETKKIIQEEPKPPIDRPLNQLVIQDALGNQTTITEGQILALPSETVDGQPQSYMLVTLDQSGNLTPLNNEALMSLDPNLGLGGDLSNMVLQIDQGALGSGSIDQPMPLAQPATVKITNPGEELQAGTSKIDIPRVAAPLSLPIVSETTIPEQKMEQNILTAPSEPSVNIESVISNSNGEQGQQLIVTGDPIATQKFLESLTEGTTDLANIIANAEGKSILIQADGQQILINTNSDNQMLTNSVESTEGGGNPIFATQPNKNTDILAAALADTDVFTSQPKIASQLSPNNTLYPMNVTSVLETSLTLSSPIMTPLEVPSTNNKKITDDEADILTQVPKNVDLPITITDPNISQTVANQQVATLIGNEFQTNLDLGLAITETTISSVSTGLTSPCYSYSLPTLDENDITHKPFNSSMPLLTDDVEDTAMSEKKSNKHAEKNRHNLNAEGFLGEESRFTLGGGMCSSLSEPPPEMFDIPDVNSFNEKNGNSIPLSLQSTPDPKDDDTTDVSIQAESSSEGSCEIPLQPKIVAKSADLSEVSEM